MGSLRVKTNMIAPNEASIHVFYANSTLNFVVSHIWQPKCTWYYGVCSVDMDAWYYRGSVSCDTTEFEFIILSSPLVWSTPVGLPRRCGTCMHQHSTSGIRRRRKKKNENKRVTLHILTHGAMRGCGLTSLVVCINDKNLWYKGEKCDNKEWDLKYEHPFLRVSRY